MSKQEAEEDRTSELIFADNNEIKSHSFDSINEALLLLSSAFNTPRYENLLKEFNSLTCSILNFNITCKTLGGILTFNDIYTVNKFRIQQHKITGYVRLLDANNYRLAWGNLDNMKLACATFIQAIAVNELSQAQQEQLKDQLKQFNFKTKKLVTKKELLNYEKKVVELEEGSLYPLGDDKFSISHGNYYFTFFERMGSLRYFVLEELNDNKIAAVAAAVIQSIPIANATQSLITSAFNSFSSVFLPQQQQQCDKTIDVTYLCDFKIKPEYRGKGLTLLMMKQAGISNYSKCPRGYMISMNPSEKDGGFANNKFANKMLNLNFGLCSAATQLQFFSLSYDDIINKKGKEIIEKHRGSISFLSLRGVKDIVLESTSKPMDLLHIQFGPLASKKSFVDASSQEDNDTNNEGDINDVDCSIHYKNAQDGSTHMLCIPVEDKPFLQELSTAGFKVSATAVVLQHRMRGWDWRFILTSGI